MGELRVRNVDEWVVSELRAMAKGNGRSLEAELRDLLKAAAFRPRVAAAERARQLREAIGREHGVLPDSAPGIRADRDGRG
jgi:plasmid stability protein